MKRKKVSFLKLQNRRRFLEVDIPSRLRATFSANKAISLPPYKFYEPALAHALGLPPTGWYHYIERAVGIVVDPAEDPRVAWVRTKHYSAHEAMHWIVNFCPAQTGLTKTIEYDILNVFRDADNEQRVLLHSPWARRLIRDGRKLCLSEYLLDKKKVLTKLGFLPSIAPVWEARNLVLAAHTVLAAKGYKILRDLYADKVRAVDVWATLEPELGPPSPDIRDLWPRAFSIAVKAWMVRNEFVRADLVRAFVDLFPQPQKIEPLPKPLDVGDHLGEEDDRPDSPPGADPLPEQKQQYIAVVKERQRAKSGDSNEEGQGGQDDNRSEETHAKPDDDPAEEAFEASPSDKAAGEASFDAPDAEESEGEENSSPGSSQQSMEADDDTESNGESSGDGSESTDEQPDEGSEQTGTSGADESGADETESEAESGKAGGDAGQSSTGEDAGGDQGGPQAQPSADDSSAAEHARYVFDEDYSNPGPPTILDFDPDDGLLDSGNSREDSPDIEQDVDDLNKEAPSFIPGGAVGDEDDRIFPADPASLIPEALRKSVDFANNLNVILRPEVNTRSTRGRFLARVVARTPDAKDPRRGKVHKKPTLAPPIYFLVMLDTSGSMLSNMKWYKAQLAAMTIHLAAERHRVAHTILTSRTAKQIAGIGISSDRAKVLIAGTRPPDECVGDNYVETFPLVVEQVRKRPEPIKVLVLATDGAPASPHLLKEAVEQTRRSGMVVKGVGLELTSYEIAGMKHIFGDKDVIVSEYGSLDGDRFAVQLGQSITAGVTTLKRLLHSSTVIVG